MGRRDVPPRRPSSPHVERRHRRNSSLARCTSTGTSSISSTSMAAGSPISGSGPPDGREHDPTGGTMCDCQEPSATEPASPGARRFVGHLPPVVSPGVPLAERVQVDDGGMEPLQAEAGSPVGPLPGHTFKPDPPGDQRRHLDHDHHPERGGRARGAGDRRTWGFPDQIDLAVNATVRHHLNHSPTRSSGPGAGPSRRGSGPACHKRPIATSSTRPSSNSP
jgi:hypothetical protein